MYFPSDIRYVDEQTLEVKPSEVELSADGRDDLLSWYFESRKENRKPITIVYAHGNGQNMSAHFRSLYWVLEQGINFFIVGYPGYGPNKGSASPRSTVDTMLAAIEWVQRHRSQDSIFIFGQSLGSNVALRAISERTDIAYCGVAVEGSFLSYKRAAQHVMSRNWFLWSFQWLSYLLISDTDSIASNVAELPGASKSLTLSPPYLVIHGKNDRTIPYELGYELFTALPENKKLWSIDEGGHINAFLKDPNVQQEFLHFIKSNCLKN